MTLFWLGLLLFTGVLAICLIWFWFNNRRWR